MKKQSVESSVTDLTDKKNQNPHEVSLGKFLSARATHVSKGYRQLQNGQIIKVAVE